MQTRTPSPFPGLKNDSLMDQTTKIKTACFILLYVLASLFLTDACKQVADRYLTIVMFSSGILDIALYLLITASCFVLTTGLVAVLVRPFWLLYITAAVPALIYLLINGISESSLILGLLFWGSVCMYAISVQKKSDNQISFSMHPLVEANKIILLTLVTIISINIALGYAQDAKRRNFIFPPEIKVIATDFMNNQVKQLVDRQTIIGQPEKDAAMDKAKQETDKMWSGLEEIVKPFSRYIPLLLGISFYITLQSANMLISWIPLLLLSLVFPLLKKLGVTRQKTEMREVSQTIL